MARGLPSRQEAGYGMQVSSMEQEDGMDYIPKAGIVSSFAARRSWGFMEGLVCTFGYVRYLP